MLYVQHLKLCKSALEHQGLACAAVYFYERLRDRRLLLQRNCFGALLATCTGSRAIFSEDNAVPSACPIVQSKRLIGAALLRKQADKAVHAC